MRLSPKYTLDNWNAAFQGPPAWDKAIDIVQDRIEGRFTRWIDPMLPKEFAGFAIIALDCLLLETLHGFLTGASTYQPRNVYTLDNWNAAFQGPPAWDKAIDIVQDRIEGRFTRWIDPMLPKEFAGFAIIALDCQTRNV